MKSWVVSKCKYTTALRRTPIQFFRGFEIKLCSDVYTLIIMHGIFKAGHDTNAQSIIEW